jgi:molybdopterin converting factor small subunit
MSDQRAVNGTTPATAPAAASIRVRLPTTYAARIGGQRSLDVPALSVGDALRDLTSRHPVLAPLIWLNGTALNPVIMIFHNESLIRDATLDTRLADGDVVDVVPAVESG